MPDTFEHIIEDIYTLEPTLREQDTEVRALVASLVSAKPAVSVDDTFVQSLRREILTKVAPAPKAIPSPFMMYLAPLGAMAVLILMLVPGYLSHSPALMPVSEPEQMSTESQMDIEESGGANMKRSVEVSADAAPEGASMMMIAPTSEYSDMVAGDMIAVFDQAPGKIVTADSVTLTTAGFIVIQADEFGVPGAVLGVSPMLFAGTSSLVDVPLTSELRVGFTYFATLYSDDGDGVFALEKDLPVSDVYGSTPGVSRFGVYDAVTQ
jgi:hypothetical protein